MRDLDSKPRHSRREAEESRRRQQQAREQVIRPLERYAEQNQFSALIRASLREGRGRHP